MSHNSGIQNVAKISIVAMCLTPPKATIVIPYGFRENKLK